MYMLVIPNNQLSTICLACPGHLISSCGTAAGDLSVLGDPIYPSLPIQLASGFEVGVP